MPLKLLLVEDDREDAVLVNDFLRDARTSFEVEWVASASAARATIAGNGFDACLIDQRLGEGATGLDIIRWARSQGVGTPMIILTGYANDDIDMEGLEAGASGFIAKDEMSPALLERTVHYAVGPSAGSGPQIDEVAVATDLAGGLSTDEVALRHGVTIEDIGRLQDEPRFADLLSETRARLTREAIDGIARSLRE